MFIAHSPLWLPGSPKNYQIITSVEAEPQTPAHSHYFCHCWCGVCQSVNNTVCLDSPVSRRVPPLGLEKWDLLPPFTHSPSHQVGLLDVANNDAECPVKLEFPLNNK